MTISVEQTMYDLFPTFHFEKSDELRAKMLAQETEVLLRNRVYELLEESMSLELVGTPEEINQKIGQLNFMKGKIDAFKELLEASRDAKQEATLTN